jgi:hypothetical protein
MAEWRANPKLAAVVLSCRYSNLPELRERLKELSGTTGDH